MNSLFVESINYSPSCQSHGEMKQQRGNDGYFWICKTNSCKNTRSGINQKSFLNLLRDLNPNIIENKDHIKKNLLYFPHLLKTDLSVLVEALKYEIDNFNDDWENNLKTLEKKSEQLLKAKLKDEKKKEDKLRQLAINAERLKRICLLCGSSRCKRINSCMVTSD